MWWNQRREEENQRSKWQTKSLSETLKSITGNDLGKVQVAEQDKSNKEKIEAAIKKLLLQKFQH
ncbi:hypothetical protein HYD71_03770 [Mycoplasmopsis bovis]|nr:hypothetical protein [Mycoplasmopsis bovis]QQH49616.1 hypothetical protein HYD71_03770 [Mycoplasmopsis bovis]